MCGPHFCSMKITEEVRDYAAKQGVEETAALEAGMKEKAEEFRCTRELVVALRDLYAYTYGVEPVDLELAAELRAEAMDVSDGWVQDGCDPEAPALAEERALLVRSYAALLAAVHR